jgi:hypothetical protein
MYKKSNFDESIAITHFCGHCAEDSNLLKRLSTGEFEFNLSIPQAAYYGIERVVCDFLLCGLPPPRSPNLLSLGCGPHS